MKSGQNVRVPRGTSHMIRVRVMDGLVVANLAGAEVEWRVGRTAQATGDDILLTKSLGDGIAATTIGVDIELVPDDTEGMAAGSYHHELKAVLADGRVAKPFRGEFFVEATLPEPEVEP